MIITFGKKPYSGTKLIYALDNYRYLSYIQPYQKPDTIKRRPVMAFKALLLAHAPDADPEKHHSVIDTGKYKLLTVVVKNQTEALKVSKDVYKSEKIDAIMLCPGFSHSDVAEIFNALDGKVSVSVSRGDGPSNRIVQPVIQREYHSQ